MLITAERHFSERFGPKIDRIHFESLIFVKGEMFVRMHGIAIDNTASGATNNLGMSPLQFRKVVQMSGARSEWQRGRKKNLVVPFATHRTLEWNERLLLGCATFNVHVAP
jgi:hypothetical protein